MIEIGNRKRSQPAPPWVLFEALTQPHRDPTRPWLILLADEHYPTVLEERSPGLVVWSSLWVKRPDLTVRFDIDDRGMDTDLRWTAFVAESIPDDAFVGHVRTRMNFLINANLRFTFGQ